MSPPPIFAPPMSGLPVSAPPILIAAFSGRAAAMAARRAGFAPLVADLFADADTSAIAAGIRRVSGDVETGFDDDALLSALGALTDEAVEPPVGLVYGAGFEDRPALLARIAERWPLLGNRPEVVAAVKEPWGFAEVLAGLGVPHPEIRAVDGALDRDDFRLDQSKIMTAIYFNSLERDSSGKPLHTFPHPALALGETAFQFRRFAAQCGAIAGRDTVGAQRILKLLREDHP